jgi:protein adenylyltransferase
VNRAHGLQPSSYARLPAHFYARLDPTPVVAPRLIRFNDALAAELGLDFDGLDAASLAAIFAGNVVPPGVEPIALAYAGHQFGYFVPQLGDGRAILLGEVRDRNGQRRDIQLKGSGPTPFSRNGDGRAALGPVLREYVISEAMHALGIPSTRALAAVLTGEVVQREQRLPGAILTRVASSHVRVGTFEFFSARRQAEAVRQLADYVIERHYPEAGSSPQPYLMLLRAVMQRQALLIARWMHVGFIHGVMNTDNMALSGETIDFGPCAFMDAYDPATVFSSIDSFGRYAYTRQPSIAQWNLARLAEALLPLLDPEPSRAVELANESLTSFADRYQQYWLEGMRGKLGLTLLEPGDLELVQSLLQSMHAGQADYTLTFRHLADAAESDSNDDRVRQLFTNSSALDDWLIRWRARLQREPRSAAARAQAMRAVSPAFIPRNHRVEQAIVAAVERDDFSVFETLMTVLSRPYDEQPQFERYAAPPVPAERVLQTFCGT